MLFLIRICSIINFYIEIQRSKMKNKLTLWLSVSILCLQFSFAGEYLDNRFKEAAVGNPEDWFNFAVTLDRGDYMLYDDDIDNSFDGQEEALILFTKAANEGYAQAQYTLGLTYLEGEDEGHIVEKNLTTAKIWFDRACTNGIKEACEKAALINE